MPINPNLYKNDLVHLEMTTTLTKENLRLPEWKMLQEDYQLVKDSGDAAVGRYMCSVLNAILSQKRIYFALTRDGVAALVRNDPNFKSGFDNSLYASLILQLTEKQKILQLLEKGTSKWSPAAYKLVDKNYLKFIQINENEQKQQTLDFIRKNNEQTANQTREADEVTRRGEQTSKPDEESRRVEQTKLGRYEATKLESEVARKLVSEERSLQTEKKDPRKCECGVSLLREARFHDPSCERYLIALRIKKETEQRRTEVARDSNDEVWE